MPAIKTRTTEKDILQGLNPEQKKAVTHGEGPMLVIAGAGTGKTSVIIRRIAYLIAAKKAKPGEILALTFTDKAAQEMESRVDRLVPYGYVDVEISTFHAFGDRILRDHALDLGLRPDYRVLSHAEQLVFCREHLFEFPLKYYKALGDPTRHLDALVTLISRAQDEDVSVEEYLKWGKKALEGVRGSKKGQKKKKGDRGEEVEEINKQIEIANVYKKYQELKAEKGFVDFGDQVALALKLFRKSPSALKVIRQKYKYILVDEFQDTNHAQFELLKLMAPGNANITAVGDDDQAIYRFRGAAVSNILDFEKAYKKCKKVVLTKNYRSTQAILDAARRLIRHNDPERLEVRAGVDKKLKAFFRTKNKRIEHRHFDRIGSEADWVARTIKKKYAAGFKYADFAVLVRANADAEPFRRALNMLGIPYQLSGGGGLYLSPDVQLVVSFLKSIGDLSDSIALYQLASSPVYRLDPLDLQKMNTFARRRNYTLHHVFTHLPESRGTKSEFEVLADVKDESVATAKKIMEDIAYYLDFAKQKTTGEVLYQFLKRSGYLLRLTSEDTPENEHRIKSLSFFFEKVKEFNAVAELDRVAEFVRHLNVLREAGDNPETISFDPDLDAVNILTVHKAKGLEFRVIFMAGLVAEKFPVRRRQDAITLPQELVKSSVPSGDFHLQEERRLFYVAMTRAREELYFTSSVDYGGKRQRKLSQFVLEALDVPRADASFIKSSPREQIDLFSPAEIMFPAKKTKNKNEPLYLSHYQIDDYQTCPLKYRYVHILRVPLLPNAQILYGAALHKAVQSYNLAKRNKQKFTEKQLQRALLDNWSAEGYISREHEEQRLAAGKKALKFFYQEQKRSKSRIKYVEESFSFTRDNLVVRGRWDRVDERDGEIFVIDYKSSEVRKQEDADRRAMESLQLAIYALAWEHKFGRLPRGVELYFLESGLVGSAEKSGQDLNKAWDKILKAAEGIRKADYSPKPNKRSCSYCSYSEICPASAV